MINWFDMPAEGLSNGGLFEVKELTATENKVYQKDGEVYNKVTVNVPSPTGKITITENGTDIDIAQYATADVNVEGGGGSSDFSTAEVTITGIGEGTTVPIIGCYCFNEHNLLLPFAEIGDGVYTVPLYKGTVAFTPDPDLVYTLSGNATDNDGIIITGDCSISFT